MGGSGDVFTSSDFLPSDFSPSYTGRFQPILIHIYADLSRVTAGCSCQYCRAHLDRWKRCRREISGVEEALWTGEAVIIESRFRSRPSMRRMKVLFWTWTTCPARSVWAADPHGLRLRCTLQAQRILKCFNSCERTSGACR